MDSGISLNSDANKLSHLAEAKDDTEEGLKEQKNAHRPIQGEVMDTSYVVSDEGVDFQAESSPRFCGGLRITRSPGLNLPPTDPGD